MKMAIFCLLVFYLACSKNIPLQLEIGLIRFDDLVAGRLQYQEINFDQPFIRSPQIALAINSIATQNGNVYFSKIQNVTTEGFTIGVLSGTEKSLEYRYMAILDDRVQIHCLNFKAKEMVFIPFKKQFVKIPKAWTFLTGLKQSTNDLTVLQDIRNEGIMLKISQTDTQLLGVCVVAGAIDILQSELDDLPKFQGYNVMKQQISFSIIAQSTFICEDECLLYYRNDLTKQFKINTQFNNIKDRFNFPSIISQNRSETIVDKKPEIQDLSQSMNNKIEKEEQFLQSMNTSIQQHDTHSDNLKAMISKTIEQLEESINHPNGVDSFDSKFIQLATNTNLQDFQNKVESTIGIIQESHSEQTQEQSQEQLQDLELSLEEEEEEDEDEEEGEKLDNFFPKYQKSINLEEEFRKLEKISSDQTKKMDILEFHPKEQVNVSFLYKDNIIAQEETTGEKLIELKYIDRAPKFSPKIQQMIDDAKKGISKDIETNSEQAIESAYVIQQTQVKEQIISDIQQMKHALKEKQQSLIDQIEAISSFSLAPDIDDIIAVNAPKQNDQPTVPIKKQQQESESISIIQSQEPVQNEIQPQIVKEQNKHQLNEYDTIFAQFTSNTNLRQNREKQSFATPLIDIEIPKEIPELTIEAQQEEPKKSLNSREERLQKYLQKADEVDLNFLENISLQGETILEENTKPPQKEQTDEKSISYTEQLNQRKNEILQELQQKYNVKPVQVQSYEEFQLKVPQDQYPQILYEKYLEQLKKQSIGTSLIETSHNGKQVESSYQLEAAYYEWQLQQNI